ncbi:MAG: hypothetical protein GQ557_01510 [Mycoplasmataceae bacterium]|nr:hypothetical protein [Mycoplasmataceae bacterium]
MKDLKILKGAKQLSKMEQKVIKGGVIYPCKIHSDCDRWGGGLCIDGRCLIGA